MRKIKKSTPIRNYPKKRFVDTVLECQKKLPFRKFCRDNLANDFFPNTCNVQEDITKIRLKEYDTGALVALQYAFIRILKKK